MKLDESIINQFDLEPNHVSEPVNVMKASEVLNFMKESADRIVAKSKIYFDSSDADIQADCLDIVSVRLNDFAQSFMDLEKVEEKLAYEEKRISLIEEYSEAKKNGAALPELAPKEVIGIRSKYNL